MVICCHPNNIRQIIQPDLVKIVDAQLWEEIEGGGQGGVQEGVQGGFQETIQKHTGVDKDFNKIYKKINVFYK